MRLLISLFLLALPCAAATLTFHIAGDDPGGWPAILSSIGLQNTAARGDIEVIPAGAASPEADWPQRVEHGTILVLEGASPLSTTFGFRAGSQRISVRSAEDLRAPQLRIVWEQAADLPRFEIPKEAQVFARERWEKAPLLAGFRRGSGAVLWIAAPPGPRGYERFPYLPQALADLGLVAPFHSARLWAFFDSSYRSRVDLDYLAPRWRQAGIAALHVAAWHYWEPDARSDEYLRRLIDACHRNSIQVYAWIELPHVSETFWDQHPEWREKTALLQDAHLDWRKLMNLTNRAAFAATAQGLRQLIDRFDWDGVNLAELYFESLEGHENPARFTPMNKDVRAEYQAAFGADPLDLFNAHNSSADAMSRFLTFRADLARRQQAEWIAQIEDARKTKSWLDLALTHVDDRFDTSMREKIGADTSRTLPLLAQHDFTFLIEDPSTVWHLGPQRYPQIAARYQALTPRAEKLAIDINVVERYQDVYPTKQQTGSELFALLHLASAAFPRVAVYFENSILAPDLRLLPSAAAPVEHAERSEDRLAVTSRAGTGVRWSGPVLVDGRPWPVASGAVVWLPPGSHAVQSSAVKPVLRLLDLNAELHSAAAVPGGMEFAYQSSARALAYFESPPARVQIDGAEAHPVIVGNVMMLPRGQHFVTALLQ
ncbi:MAG TPA: hypothetical protein VLN48_16405 [Bryobacteraceae bacterium]|nr:hypothetical protein [Bryobacteraceae bacterium]